MIFQVQWAKIKPQTCPCLSMPDLEAETLEAWAVMRSQTGFRDSYTEYTLTPGHMRTKGPADTRGAECAMGRVVFRRSAKTLPRSCLFVCHDVSLQMMSHLQKPPASLFVPPAVFPLLFSAICLCARQPVSPRPACPPLTSPKKRLAYQRCYSFGTGTESLSTSSRCSSQPPGTS